MSANTYICRNTVRGIKWYTTATIYQLNVNVNPIERGINIQATPHSGGTDSRVGVIRKEICSTEKRPKFDLAQKQKYIKCRKQSDPDQSHVMWQSE